MDYKGKLYGKVGGKYIPMCQTAKDVDNLEQQIKDLEKINYTQSIIISKQNHRIKKLEEKEVSPHTDNSFRVNELLQQIKELKERLHNSEKTLLTIDGLHNDSERTSELVHEYFLSTDNETKSAEFRKNKLNKH